MQVPYFAGDRRGPPGRRLDLERSTLL